jgi:hypothetical protein
MQARLLDKRFEQTLEALLPGRVAETVVPRGG